MANKLVARQSKKDIAKSRANELKEKYTVEFSNDGSTYRLVDKKTGQVSTETNAGVAYGDKSTRNRTNKLIGREMTKGNTFPSFRFSDEPRRRVTNTTTKIATSNTNTISKEDETFPEQIKLIRTFKDKKPLDINTLQLATMPIVPQRVSTKEIQIEDFNNILDDLSLHLNENGVSSVDIKSIINELVKNPKAIVEYGKSNRQYTDLSKLIGDRYVVPGLTRGNKPLDTTTDNSKLIINPITKYIVEPRTSSNWADPYQPKGKTLHISKNKYDKVDLNARQPLFNFKLE